MMVHLGANAPHMTEGKKIRSARARPVCYRAYMRPIPATDLWKHRRGAAFAFPNRDAPLRMFGRIRAAGEIARGPCLDAIFLARIS